MQVYLDNASTTKIDSEVFEYMLPYMTEYFGNPSSIHKYGRKAKVAIENARTDIANFLGVTPGEIFFTSGGTESNNMILRSAVQSLEITDIISSKLEHASVYNTIQDLVGQNIIKAHWVELDSYGNICCESLETLLKGTNKTLVTLMHGNNEIGNLLDLNIVGDLCKKYNAFFHTDSVQTIGKYNINLDLLPIDFAVGSSHKFHGPKGIGFVYINSRNKIAPMLTGGAQERNMRAGTENVAGIVGMAKALEIALSSLNETRCYISLLKKSMIEVLQNNEKIFFNGNSANLEKSLYTILNVGLKTNDSENMLLFNLDAAGICASAGSACSSGSSKTSRIISNIHNSDIVSAVRFSFSKYNTPEDVEYCVKELLSL